MLPLCSIPQHSDLQIRTTHILYICHERTDKHSCMHTAPHGITVHNTTLHYTAPCCNTTPCSIQRTAHRTRTHEHPHSCVPLSSAIWREGSCVSQLLTVVLIGCSMMVTSRLGPLGHHGTPGRPTLFYTAHIPRWSTGLMGTV